ncbi:ion channel [Flavobacterium capsici]|uniref:Ion channel n=1 Tax=Flavobacterium capsici TaxID=3075618 RepID=A0AA96F532_9FLAO|nr:MULTISPECIES: ion channel [unclassified Flavobacterium]WNM18819.1 ion channel [Flavobacterium sp. PMR2A8]WNM22870.1 ion channel [Flavobacterium sp. PMTSA4]
MKKTGNANVKKIGVGFFDSISWDHTMLNIPRWKFMVIVVNFYVLVNLLFACVYYVVGVEHLVGVSATTKLDQFGMAFFFSIQTFTTVGYGHISPSGFMTSMIASIEALSGLLSFAIATGLFYGRFSMPKAHVRFSENALIAPYGNGTALMFRMTPYKNTNLTDAEAKVTLGMVLEENGKFVNKFYTLDLELDKINALTLSWTLVHPITENSPLYKLTAENFKNDEGEILVFFKTFDDMFSSNVVKRTSYTFKEVVYGAKFKPMFSKSTDDNKTILHIDKLNDFEKVDLA